MKGRKQKPKTQKVIQGTFRSDRDNPAAPVAVSDVPRAPSWLSKRACEIFGAITARIEAMGYASSSHTEALALIAMRQEEIEICSEIITKEGPVYSKTAVIEAESGEKLWETLKKSNPAVAQRSEAARHLQSLLAEFGLTPASMGKVSVPEKQKGKSAWDEVAL